MAAEWSEHAIWWQVYPLGFVGAPREGRPDADVVHRLGRIGAWLDYVIEMGCSGIALGPVFASETHGYDTVDHFTIDPRLGSEADFEALVEAAHSRGLRILLDGVFNHVGRAHPAFAAALAGGPASETASWFRLDWPDGWSPGDAPPRADNFEGHDALVALDHDDPAVVELVADVMTHWLDRGADGWRLDAAYAVPAAFWAQVLPRVRDAHPHAWIVGEVIHGDYAGIVAESGMDSVTQYELWKAVGNGIVERNFFELAWSMKRHNQFLESFVPMTFVGNHDVTRLATLITDERHRQHALVVLMTVGGVPAVYYGDEQGFTGLKEERAGGDDAIRPAFPDGPDDLAAGGWSTYHRHQELIALRRRHPWLHRGRTAELSLTNTGYAYEVRSGDDRLVVALNIGDDTLELTGLGASQVRAGHADLVGGTVRVPGHGWVVLG
ncbi:alpha-amylase family glycosyl hydrolase [Nakamurella deserti]|uniref:alpha-amylase family glycosyl hydrolase n=1 Tax=Nakamurella deserti TaxID=2164074 RepID=UPI000DBE0069